MPTWDPRANEVFLKALDMPSGGERQAYLNGACAGDPALRAEVKALLEASARAGSFLESPPPGLPTPVGGEMAAMRGGATVGDPSSESPGTVIVPYKLIEQIGEGGMGAVWMAQQTEPVKRLVALKLIKAGMDSKQVIARFEAERQALALMDHANIARVLDAGATDAGRPYFVMDLVKGTPVTKYCDEHHLTPRQRLELFIPVCQAVQHAHQKGIIHRDLKPSNVLVALYDGKPVPKVIDFGVAKAAGQSLTDKTLVTGFGNVVGTLEYMSPEQAELNQLDIDTRSDIYSLGVLLYELLTGSPPFTGKDSEKVGMLEMLRVIREEEPTKPSTKLSTADGLPALAANRGTEPAKLAKLVRGELDWIVMKALEKDRNRRYETANGFAMDVQRYLADEPVQACPPSVGYRFRKFARRHRVVLSTAALVCLAMLLGTAVSVWQAIRAYEYGEAEANARADEHRQRLLAQDNMRLGFEALERIYMRVVEDELPRNPERLEQNRQVLQEALGFYKAFAEKNAGDPAGQRELAIALARAGNIARLLYRHNEALELDRQAATVFIRLAHDKPNDASAWKNLAAVHTQMGNSFRSTGRFKEAADAYDESLRAAKESYRLAKNSTEQVALLALIHQNRGGFFREIGRPDEAEAEYRQGCDQDVTVLGANMPADLRFRMAACREGYGILLVNVGRYEEADKALGDAAAEFERLRSEQPAATEFQSHLGRCWLNLGASYALQGRRREARETLDQARHVMEKLARDYPLVPAHTSALIDIYANLDASAGNNILPDPKWLRQALTLAEDASRKFPELPEFRSDLLRLHMNLGVNQATKGHWTEAESSYQMAKDLADKLIRQYPQVPEYACLQSKVLMNLGKVNDKLKRHEQAETGLRLAVDLARTLATTHPKVTSYQLESAHLQEALVIHLRDLSRPKDAERIQKQVIAELESLHRRLPEAAKPWHDFAHAHLMRGSLLFDQQRYPEALEAFDRCEQIMHALMKAKGESASRQAQIAHVHLNRGDVFRTTKKFTESEKAYRVGIALQEKLVNDDPADIAFRANLWLMLDHFLIMKHTAGRLMDAEPEVNRALEVSRELARAEPSMPKYRHDLVMVTVWLSCGSSVAASDHSHVPLCVPTWLTVPSVTAVTVIQQVTLAGLGPSVINVSSNGALSVIILSTPAFDPSRTDPATVLFAGAHVFRSDLTDVNGDGNLDLVLQFRRHETQLLQVYAQLVAEADQVVDGRLDAGVSNRQRAKLLLTGQTYDGLSFQGSVLADLFMSGNRLRELLEELAADGLI